MNNHLFIILFDRTTIGMAIAKKACEECNI